MEENLCDHIRTFGIVSQSNGKHGGKQVDARFVFSNHLLILIPSQPGRPSYCKFQYSSQSSHDHKQHGIDELYCLMCVVFTIILLLFWKLRPNSMLLRSVNPSNRTFIFTSSFPKPSCWNLRHLRMKTMISASQTCPPGDKWLVDARLRSMRYMQVNIIPRLIISSTIAHQVYPDLCHRQFHQC